MRGMSKKRLGVIKIDFSSNLFFFTTFSSMIIVVRFCRKVLLKERFALQKK